MILPCSSPVTSGCTTLFPFRPSSGSPAPPAPASFFLLSFVFLLSLSLSLCLSFCFFWSLVHRHPPVLPFSPGLNCVFLISRSLWTRFYSFILRLLVGRLPCIILFLLSTPVTIALVSHIPFPCFSLHCYSHLERKIEEKRDHISIKIISLFQLIVAPS